MAEIPLIVVNVQRGGPSTGLPTNVEQSDLYQAIFGGHGDSPRVVLAASTVEDCFYIAIEAARIARKYSTPVIILSDSSLATRIEAFDEPELKTLMQDPKPDLTPRRQASSPTRLIKSRITLRPERRMRDGKYPVVTGLEHDEMGHPTGSPKLHAAMTAKRRSKLQLLAEEIPRARGARRSRGRGAARRVGFDVSVRSTKPSTGRESAAKAFPRCTCVTCIPCRTGSNEIFDRFKRVIVVEMNDAGLYGYGQLATILRARYCNPRIRSLTKTDGLTFRVREILEGVLK